jgi:hypothetical protein
MNTIFFNDVDYSKIPELELTKLKLQGFDIQPSKIVPSGEAYSFNPEVNKYLKEKDDTLY